MCVVTNPGETIANNAGGGKMSSLLPQFKCQTHFIFQFRTHHHTPSFPTYQLSKDRDLLCFRTKCVLSATSPSMVTTPALDMEKLRLPSLEAHSNSASASCPWTYTGAVSLPTEMNFKATLTAETLVTSDEAVIAAAAAKAVALAREAVKVANDAALMVNGYYSMSTVNSPVLPSRYDASPSKWGQFTERERAGILEDTLKDETTSEDVSSLQQPEEYDNLEPTVEELYFLEKQLSESVAVRSRRQTERKARRTRAVEKAAANVVSLKYGSTSRKKRISKDVDYSDPLRFLKGTSSTSSRLLTFSEETRLSEGIQGLLKLERLRDELAERYGCQPTFAQWAAAAGVDQRTLRKHLNHGTLCKDKMIKCNIRLVIFIAKNYQGAGMTMPDLVLEGCRGLVTAAEKFDASKGFKFSTYAHWWIKQAVRKALSDQSRTIRVPFHIAEATYRVKEARKQVYSEKGRHPNTEEVAEVTGLSMKRVNAVLLTPKTPRSLDQKFGLNDVKPSEVIADPEAQTSEDILSKQFMKQDLEKVLDSLNSRERQVVKMRFGMEGGRMKTLQEIGELMGISRERIRQIESSALRKLKNMKGAKHLQQYLFSLA